MKESQNLIKETGNRTDVLSQARSVANRASSEYGSEASVSTYASSVLTQCNTLSSYKTAAINPT
jgi:hypothetical protein